MDQTIFDKQFVNLVQKTSTVPIYGLSDIEFTY